MPRLWVVLLALVLAGCAARAPLPSTAAVELTEVPFYPQQEYQCGPAALATLLRWSGVETDPERLVPRVYLPARQGSLQPEIIAEARRHGRLSYVLPPRFDAMLAELQAGHPVLVLQNLGLSWWPVWHYAVVVGYDPVGDDVILRSGRRQRHIVSRTTFEHTWRRADRWALITLQPPRLPATAEPDRLLEAAFALERGGAVDAARLSYRAAAARWPADARIALALANIEYGRGALTDAAATLAHAIAAGAEDGALYNNLAVIRMELGDWIGAAEAARRAVMLGGPLADEFARTWDQVCTSVAPHHDTMILCDAQRGNPRSVRQGHEP